jgi:hypothetical protein
MRLCAERLRALRRRAACAAIVVITIASSSPWCARPARADSPPVMVRATDGVAADTAARVRRVVAERRSIRDGLPVAPRGRDPAEVGMRESVAHIERALEQAREQASEAAWSDCVRLAGAALGRATEVLARTGGYQLLRDLHLQIGVCLTLEGRGDSASPHFTSATLLDESEPRPGLFRKEAEDARGEVRATVLQRTRGKVRIVTEPPGAEVSIDGRPAAGTTPVEVDVRAGEHFVTVRRFRYEPATELRFLQPSAELRIVLEPARRGTLADQLATVTAPSAVEKDVALAAWSRAEQLLRLEPLMPSRSAVRLVTYDTSSGKRLREASLTAPQEDDAVRSATCAALGERCAAVDRGPPWYVWPIAIAGVATAGLAIGLIVEGERDVRLCPSGGCR